MKNDIVIEIENLSGKILKYEPLDLEKNLAVSLEYRSNMLTSIENITCSSSYTIKVPHTANNDSILDLAKMPSHNSEQLYRKIGCRVHINGFDMVGPAWCYITDSDKDSYSLVIVFGLMQNLSSWLTAKPGLRDLNPYKKNSNSELDRIVWNQQSSDTQWASHCISKYTNSRRSMYYGTYYCGTSLTAAVRELCNRHPWVSLREIYERIVSENSLSFNMPSAIKDRMKNLGLLLTSDNSKGDSAQTASLVTSSTPINIGLTNRDGCFLALYLDDEKYYDGVETDSLNTPEQWRYQGFLRLGYTTATMTIFPTKIHVYGIDDYYDFFAGDNWGLYDKLTMYYPLPNGTYQGVNATFVTINGIKCAEFTIPTITSNTISNHIGHIVIRGKKVENTGGGEYVSVKLDSSKVVVGQFIQDAFGYHWQNGVNIVYRYTLDNQGYPTYGYYNLVENLPSISQIDFIKALCHMFGLFPVVGKSNVNSVDFVQFSVLKDNADNGICYDWSDKLIDTGRVSPEKIAFTINDYAKRNKIAYKLDERDELRNDQYVYLVTDNEVLEQEKDLIVLPWAASSVGVSDTPFINQYHADTDSEQRTTVEFTELEYRLLEISGITEDENDASTSKQLKFPVSLEMQSLFESYYEDYQSIVRRPKTITERIMLDEYDLKTLDVTKPVYLRKYGRYFAIIYARWSSNSRATEVKLLML